MDQETLRFVTRRFSFCHRNLSGDAFVFISSVRLAFLVIFECNLKRGAQEQKEADLCEFKASMVYRVSSRTGRATHR